MYRLPFVGARGCNVCNGTVKTCLIDRQLSLPRRQASPDLTRPPAAAPNVRHGARRWQRHA
eukprot:1078320-Prymnesium_polylepis.1